MRSESAAFRRALASGRRDFSLRAELELSDGTQLTLTNSDLWEDAFTIDDSVTSGSDFEIGAAVVNSATVGIENFDGRFSTYDFFDAKLTLYAGFAFDSNTEWIKKGVFTVEEPTYSGEVITLKCLDNMAKLDKPYSGSNLTYPATLLQIVNDACSRCGLTLATQQFPHRSYSVVLRPEDEALTYREVVAWAAQIAGCFARCNADGQLELTWFDQAALTDAMDSLLDGGEFDASTPYATGDAASGGTFNPWATGTGEYDDGNFSTLDNVHHIYSATTHSVSVDDVVITGIRVRVKTSTDASDAYAEYTSGTAGYVLSIEDNGLVQSPHGQDIADWLGAQLIGFTFRPGDITHPSDPGIEAGDVAVFWDHKGNAFPIVVSRTAFGATVFQDTQCIAEPPARNSSARYSAATKTYVELRKQIIADHTAWDTAIGDLSDRLDAKTGLYTTQETTSSGTIYYLHDQPDLADSSTIWKMTSDAWGVSTDGGDSWNAGLTVDGTLIARILTAQGVNADWINAGALSVKDSNGVEIFRADIANKSVTIKGEYVTLGNISLSSAISAAQTAATNNAVSQVDRALTQQDIFNRLTNNGAAQGLALINGQLYISFSYAQGGTLKLGGANNTNGVMEVYDASGNVITQINRTGVATTALTASDYVYVDSAGGSRFKVPFKDKENAGSYLGYFDVSENGCEIQTAESKVHIGGYTNSWVYPTDPDTGDPIYTGYNGVTITPKNPTVWDVYTPMSQPGAYLTHNQFKLYSASGQRVEFTNSNGYFSGDLSCGGTKNRIVETEDYSQRKFYCYETASPYFGDIGSGQLDETGHCRITLDPVLVQAIEDAEYQVFLQAYGGGSPYVTTRQLSYFEVAGLPGLEFGWEVKAKQKGYSTARMEQVDATGTVPFGAENGTDYGLLAGNHLEEIARERGQAG